MVLISVVLMTSNVKYVFICLLVICISSFTVSVNIFAQFFMRCVSYFLNCGSSLCILGTSNLLNIYFVNILF